VIALYPEYMDDMYDEKVKVREDVMYKVLDKDDRENQGLYKMTYTYYIDRRGMSLVLRHKVEPGDIFLVDVFLEEDNALIKACCEVISCNEREAGSYRACLKFIIIKDSYRERWEEFLNRKIEAKVL
jgi:c-di-GMP-binding flagellar brake protein YcgR